MIGSLGEVELVQVAREGRRERLTIDVAADERIRISNGPSSERPSSTAPSLRVCDYDVASVYEG